ncbi:hypothetical protein E9549_07630 [Blastococcus sp. MG754426]|uniref:hypothetical protein n=1 Tax=unclassified Blastococcus TaxID=2619396 RepID=UPI001EF0B8E6|nr:MULTISPECIES: hypothetical protein [unclassified Blastococcus]MCF6507277.1 hypothetical protein [Blastococcus sp. MG754426]MCF6510763.1 hypothetical protein [Blastococcus sp. MG754427]
METQDRGHAVGADVRRPRWPDEDRWRRPSGLEPTGRRRLPRVVLAWSVAVVAAVAGLLVRSAHPELVAGLDREARDLLLGAEEQVPGWAESMNRLGGVLGYRVLWFPVLLVLVWTTRWRHLVVYLGTVSVVAAVAQLALGPATLARAFRDELTGSPDAVHLPAWPLLVLATVATATLLVLTPSGPARRWGWSAVVLLLGVVSAGRVALGHDVASTEVLSALLGCGLAAVAFHVLAPEDAFPVSFRRQVKAHLRLDGERCAAVSRAVREQLGLRLTALEPYRLDGSAGSTPCRLRIAGPPEGLLFGKLYSSTHLHSDRWYKLARVLRYGRLEDEAPFSSVRRLVEHEDYMLRLLRDAGVRVPEPVGVVEVVPGREYLLVTELVPDAVEVLDAPVGEALVDDALVQVRRLWAAGAAHRDIKPSNVLAQGARAVLVDVSFGELRPSRWRQAVDLANMLLVLALAVGTERVLARARQYFDEQELAEAFAATGSVTVPRQLRRRIDASGRDLLAEFRASLPHHPRIRIQRWSARRLLLALATVGGIALTVALAALNLRAGGLL